MPAPRHCRRAGGAAILAPARAGRIERGGAGWTVEVLHDGGTFEIRARLLIDGRGRSAKPLAATKAGRRVVDRVVCGWITGADPRATGFGWWYGAPLPGGRRILAFHTDADLPAAADASNPRRLAERAARVSIPAAALPNTGFAPVTDSGFCAAHGSRLDPPSGDGWFAVGDACLALDPLSSQGLLNALFTGLAAAEASDRILSGQAAACGDYKLNIDAIWNAYAHLMPAWYGQERRWRDQPFWRRRATPGSHAEARIAR